MDRQEENSRGAIDPAWEEIHSSRSWGQYPSEGVIRFVARNYYRMQRSEVRILDYGCGGGAHTWYLAREGFDTYAFDGSPSAVKHTKEKLEREQVSADVRVLDGTQIDYPETFFDAVIDSACIGHNRIADIRTMYRQIHQILKKDGRLFTSFFTTKTTGYGDGTELEPGTYRDLRSGVLQDLGTVHFWREGELEALLTEIGFHDIQVYTDTREESGIVIQTYSVHAQK